MNAIFVNEPLRDFALATNRAEIHQALERVRADLPMIAIPVVGGMPVKGLPTTGVANPSRLSEIVTRLALATRADKQVRVEFDLWEGESNEAAKNRHLGRWAVVDLPEAPAGDVLVLLELTLDTDGTVRLSATELVSGERLQLEQIFHAGLARSDVSRLARQFAEMV
jgi:molecular chaperone DnaK